MQFHGQKAEIQSYIFAAKIWNRTADQSSVFPLFLNLQSFKWHDSWCIEKATQRGITFMFCKSFSLAFIIKKFAVQPDVKTEQFWGFIRKCWTYNVIKMWTRKCRSHPFFRHCFLLLTLLLAQQVIACWHKLFDYFFRKISAGST